LDDEKDTNHKNFIQNNKNTKLSFEKKNDPRPDITSGIKKYMIWNQLDYDEFQFLFTLRDEY
jgi:hypothetical protein